MRVLRIHAPNTDPALAGSVCAAVTGFNAGLDIRLRFLSIVIEEQVLEVSGAADAAETVSASVHSTPPDVVVLMGEGEAAVAAAAAVIRAHHVLVRVGAGARHGASADANRAVDRIATMHLAHGGDALAALEAEGLGGAAHDVGPPGDPSIGERVVGTLSRARRMPRGGE